MDPLIGTVLQVVAREGVRLGSKAIEEGAQLVSARLRGELTDEAIMRWLREQQDGGEA